LEQSDFVENINCKELMIKTGCRNTYCQNEFVDSVGITMPNIPEICRQNGIDETIYEI